jgi:opacity protein-like surface antigen
MLRLKHDVTEPLVAIGGGVSIPLADRFTADVGYRFLRIFTDDPRINVATMTAGAGWSF